MPPSPIQYYFVFSVPPPFHFHKRQWAMAPTLHLSDDASTDHGANTPAAMPSLTHVPGLGDMNPLLLSDNAGIAAASHSPMPGIPPIPPSFSAASTVDASQQMDVANRATAKNPSQASLTHLPEAASAQR